MIELNGYIKLHRKLVQWGWYTDYVVKDMFLHLLIMASFRETAWMGRIIRPGQLITSRGRLAEELGFSVQQVRTALTKLKSTNEITIETTNKYTIITVVNWDKYQVVDEIPTSTSTNTPTNEQPSSNHQATNNQPHRKNVKNNKNVKKEKKGGFSAAFSDGFASEEMKAFIEGGEDE